MNVTLPTALREAARRIGLEIVRYDWRYMWDCNCGILAQLIIGTDREGLRQRLSDDPYLRGGWASALNHCPVTDMQVGTILRTLGDAGLSARDVAALEKLADPEVRARAGLAEKWDTLDYNDRPSVAAYMRAMADVVDERETPAPEPAAEVEELELVGAGQEK